MALEAFDTVSHNILLDEKTVGIRHWRSITWLVPVLPARLGPEGAAWASSLDPRVQCGCDCIGEPEHDRGLSVGGQVLLIGWEEQSLNWTVLPSISGTE